MKLRVLLSILFIITTSFSAVHELEHIYEDHDSFACKVCVVDTNAFPLPNVNNLAQNINTSFTSFVLENQLLSTHIKKNTNHATAPPVLS